MNGLKNYIRPQTSNIYKRTRTTLSTNILGNTFYSGNLETLDRFRFLAVLGQGSYAVVKLARD